MTGVRDGGVDATGTLTGLGNSAPISIARDPRGIPHIRAQNERDLYFAEGYCEGSDRLFQIDIYRRLVAGRLAELVGNGALESDERARLFDVAGIVHDQLASLAPDKRANLDAFAAGINAAIRTRPLPPEFRVLFNRTPEQFTASDALMVGFATTLSLTDSWEDVLARADVVANVGTSAYDAFYPITDPAHDAPTTGTHPAPVAPLPPLSVINASPEPIAITAPDVDRRVGLGSNNFTAGAQLTATHRALLANDPHLGLHIPGIWYLVDLEAPGIHVAGATLAGVPGVILGHNDHVAWGATNGTVATVAIYREKFTGKDTYLDGTKTRVAEKRVETFGVFLGKPVVKTYLRTRHGFVFADRGAIKFAAAWTADRNRRDAFGAFDGLDRAKNTAEALAALATYSGPPQNFVIADDTGNAGYHLAGQIPIDKLWARDAYDGPTTPLGPLDPVPFAQLPNVPPSRSSKAFTANARMYGAGYPYRLSAYFSAPFRAARIAEHLAHPPFDVASFAAIQDDVHSLAELELARAAFAAYGKHGAHGEAHLDAAASALSSWNGDFTSDSTGAVVASMLRRAAQARFAQYHLPTALAEEYLGSGASEAFVTILRMVRDRPRGYVPKDDYDAFLVDSLRDAAESLARAGTLGKTWGEVGARVAKHPLAGFGISQWNGATLPGLGDGYSPHVQGPDITQSFRAVWDVGAWDNGGIVIPQGESGEPGSPHYRDAAPGWIAEKLVPFPFGDTAVKAATVSTLTLAP
jgi:penicillin amidase